MIMITDSGYSMVMRMMLAPMLYRGRMSCSRAGEAIRSKPVHHEQIMRFLASSPFKNARLLNF